MHVELTFQATGQVPGNAGAVTMSGGNLTIGRDEENDLTLPDPDQTISRRHAVIEVKGEAVVVVDLSSNGTFLNYSKSPLGKREAPLNSGDILSIGPYELIVIIGEPDIPDPLADIAPPVADKAIMEGGATVDDIAAVLDGKGDEGDFLDDLLGEKADPSTSRKLYPDDEGGILPPLGAEDDPILPDTPVDPHADMGASFAEAGQRQSDNFAPPSSSQAVIPEDFDDDFQVPGAETPDFDDAPVAPGPAEAPIPDAPVGDLPRTVLPKRETNKAQPVEPSPPPGSAADAEAAAAFLAALGLDPGEVTPDEMTEVMERLGGILRAMIVGLRELLMTRAAFKSEFPIERTMIRASGNNPLKFSVSEDQAVRAMVRRTDKGYLDAIAATEEALRDIRAHEIGMVTGMQAALKGVLRQLDPDELEERMAGGSGLAKLFQGQKSRYWEAYKERYGEISEQAEEDFDKVFGKEFARAYLEQMRKI